MSRSLSAVARMVRPAALVQPLPIAIALVLTSAIVIAVNYQLIGPEFAEWLNSRSDKFYSAAFTFLSTFWAASLSIWALLKSRIGKYIESLYDNSIYVQFLQQFERRLLYVFVTLCGSFCIYVQDV